MTSSAFEAVMFAPALYLCTDVSDYFLTRAEEVVTVAALAQRPGGRYDRGDTES
jgi:hypothetical protein